MHIFIWLTFLVCRSSFVKGCIHKTRFYKSGFPAASHGPYAVAAMETTFQCSYVCSVDSECDFYSYYEDTRIHVFRVPPRSNFSSL